LPLEALIWLTDAENKAEHQQPFKKGRWNPNSKEKLATKANQLARFVSMDFSMSK
jgi:hypothetical protein